jgi:GT2 family glycosyltransferase
MAAAECGVAVRDPMTTSQTTPSARAPSTISSVGVVIVTFNSADMIVGCLADLGPALEGVHDVHVVVVDNNSSDRTCELVQESSPHVQLLRRTDNGGYATGFNAGAAVVPDADALLLLNPDVRLHAGSVAVMLEAFNLPATGVVAPSIVGRTGDLEPNLRRESTVLRALGEAVLGGGRAGRHGMLGEVVIDADRYAVPGVAQIASGAVMMISRRCYDELGGWDESFFHGSEETDFCLRAGDAGWLVRYAPSARATHLGGRSERSPELRALMFWNRAELFRRRRGRRRAVMFRAALVLNEALRIHRGAHHRATLRTLATGRRPPTPPEAA